VSDLRPGDEVFGSLWTGSMTAGVGAFAEFTVVPAAQLVRKPPELSFTEAGASVMSGLTALLAVRDTGRVGPGTRVLVNGASGGVGTFAVQIAALLGAHVTGVCSARNVELVRSLGADEVIDYAVEDHTRGTRRYDVVLDNVLNHPPAATAAVLAPGGTFIPNSIGRTDGLLGGLPRVARAKLMRRAAVTSRSVACEVTRENLEALSALLAPGDVKVIVERTYPLEDAAGAVAHMMSHRARGNIAITA
jgi:NADPH:quinone reductase-like Zn-dependent oxidoreductase